MSKADSETIHGAGDRLLRTDEAARFIGLRPRALESWRNKGTGPAFVKIGSRVIRYRMASLQEWLQRHEVGR